MSIKVTDVEYVRFSVPDLAAMRSFLLDFGLVDAEDVGDGVLRMRGTGSVPVVHETVEGPPAFLALALRAASVDDLDALAAVEGASVVPAAGPGGGRMVALTDPNGFRVEVIAGRAAAIERPHAVRSSWNTLAARGRPGAVKRIDPGPAGVVRLGHVVLGVDDMAETWSWWRSRFGLIMSDEVRAPDGSLAAGIHSLRSRR